MKELNLLATEQGFLLADIIPSIASVTFYKGKPPIEYLKCRTQAIVASNVWLSSKHSKKKDGSPPHMVYDEHNPPDLFQVVKGDLHTKINRRNSYHEITKAAENLLVKRRAEERDEDKGSLLVSLITKDDSTEDDEFALVVSLSHVVGDGHSFYAIHNMLCSDAEVHSLDPIRQQEFPSLEKEVMGVDESRGVMSDPAVLIRSVIGKLKMNWTRGLKTEAYFVDERQIKEQKKSKCNLDNVKFVSTNDIVTSWFFSSVKAKFATMFVNLRNRIDGVTDMHVGNYENAIIYQPGDYESPALMRQSVQRLKRKNSSYPSFWTRSMKKPYAMITNWSTFDKGVRLPGAQQLLHLPVYTIDSLFPNLYFCVIFRPMKDKLGMLFISDNGLPTSAFESQDCPLGDVISIGRTEATA